MSTGGESALLLAHVRDLLSRAAGGEVTYTAYLTPGEQLRLMRTLGSTREDLLLDGGYAAAERKRLFCLPPWMEGANKELLCEWLTPVREEALTALRITGSGFVTLTHRDYLGAILHLGIERAALGDLCVTGTHEAVLLCDRVMAAFLTEHLERVANDAVRVGVTTLAPDFDGGRTFRTVQDTVASPRSDAVVAALAGLSRERACDLFRRGLVEIDYEPTDKTDKPLSEGCVVTIRGKGKFILRSLSEQTKKGRYRLIADQYV